MGPGTSYQSRLRLQTCAQNSFFSYLSPGQLWWFSTMWFQKLLFVVIPKITFANLCETNQDVIITPVPSSPLNLENVERKGKKSKICRDRKEIFRWNKKTFFVILQMLSYREIKKREDKKSPSHCDWLKFPRLLSFLDPFPPEPTVSWAKTFQRK